jgi:hypothetical protein
MTDDTLQQLLDELAALRAQVQALEETVERLDAKVFDPDLGSGESPNSSIIHNN